MGRAFAPLMAAVFFVGLVTLAADWLEAAANAGPRPCEAQASAPAPAEARGIRLVSASQVFAGHVVALSDGAIGVVVERGGPSGTWDVAPSVRVLILEAGAGAGGLTRGQVADLPHSEVVVDLGELRAKPTVPAEWVKVGNR